MAKAANDTERRVFSAGERRGEWSQQGSVMLSNSVSLASMTMTVMLLAVSFCMETASTVCAFRPALDIRIPSRSRLNGSYRLSANQRRQHPRLLSVSARKSALLLHVPYDEAPAVLNSTDMLPSSFVALQEEEEEEEEEEHGSLLSFDHVRHDLERLILKASSTWQDEIQSSSDPELIQAFDPIHVSSTRYKDTLKGGRDGVLVRIRQQIQRYARNQEVGKTTTSSKMTTPAAATFAQEKEATEEGEGFFFFGLGEQWTARVLLLLAAALYGTNFTMVKILDETMPVGVSTTLRFGMAAFSMLPWLLAPPDSTQAAGIAEAEQQQRVASNLPPFLQDAGNRVDDWKRSNPTFAASIDGFVVGIFSSIGYVAQAIGLQTTEASKSAFICSLAVVIVPILDFVAGKKILPREVGGALMAVVGVGMLELGGGEAGSIPSLSFGDVASLMQPLTFGIGFWKMEECMRKHPTEASRTTAAQLFAIFVASAMYGLQVDRATLFDGPQMMGWLTDPHVLGALFWTGIVTTAFTIYLETVALKTLSAAETTMIFSTEPLWGAAFAAAVVGERFGACAALGAGLILGGCIFSNIGLSWLPESLRKQDAGDHLSSSSAPDVSRGDANGGDDDASTSSSLRSSLAATVATRDLVTSMDNDVAQAPTISSVDAAALNLGIASTNVDSADRGAEQFIDSIQSAVGSATSAMENLEGLQDFA